MTMTMTMTLVKIMAMIVTLTICRILILVEDMMMKVNVVFVLANVVFAKLAIGWGWVGGGVFG